MVIPITVQGATRQNAALDEIFRALFGYGHKHVMMLIVWDPKTDMDQYEALRIPRRFSSR